MKNRQLIALAVVAAVMQTGVWPAGSWQRGRVSSSDVMGAEMEAEARVNRPAPPAPAAPAMEAEPIDGVGNNLANPTWASAGTDLLRITPAGYADGIDAPALPGDLSARLISNILNTQSDPNLPTADIQTIDENSLSDFGYAFGQFLDHDMDLTPDGGASFPIPVAANDPMGPNPIDFTRSQTDPATGTSSPAQQVNVVTSYLDLSQVYGSNETVASALRTFQGGLLKTSPGNMLPYDNSTYFTADQIAALNMANDSGAVPTDELFATGDRRGNENIELTALETLFVRNHNLIARAFQQRHPEWTDEDLYQEARKLNIAEYQSVVYNEWVPAVLGTHALAPYAGYRPNVNAAISNEFSTVAFRFGHSMVSPSIAREGNDGQELTASISLYDDFFDPNLLNPHGVVDPLTGLTSTDIGPILKADADGNGQAMDNMAIEDIRNLLFGNGGFGGEDLMARDVQRARDNGIADYNTVRGALGLPAVTSFAQIGGYVSVDDWAQAYPGGVNTIDSFEGGIAEMHVEGSDVGPTFQAIMVDQFERLRDGDRFFYLNEPFDGEETIAFHQESTLAKIIMANTNVTNLQANVMKFHASISGAVTAGHQKGGGAQVVVELEDASGDVLATTATNALGQYSFDELSGPSNSPEVSPGVSATGMYRVVVVPPKGMKQSSSNPPAILISRGDLNVKGINFSLAPLRATTTSQPPKKPAPRKH